MGHISSYPEPGKHESRKSKQDQDNDSDHDLQVRDPPGRFLCRPASGICCNPTGCAHAAAPAVTHTHGRPGFAVPAANARAVVVRGEATVGAVLSPAVLAGEGQRVIDLHVVFFVLRTLPAAGFPFVHP